MQSRAKKITEEAGLSDQVSFIKADFMHIPVPDNTYDAVYAIEATCHSPDKAGCFAEILRVLKPGGYFGAYEVRLHQLEKSHLVLILSLSFTQWVMTDLYDKTNPKHVDIKEGIEKGNSLPELAIWHEVDDAMKEAGFELVESKDLSPTSDKKTPWHLPLSGSLSISGFKHTRWGRWCTHKMVSWLEWAHIAPKGTTEVSKILMDTADQLVLGGETNVFTPLWFILGRKPLKE